MRAKLRPLTIGLMALVLGIGGAHSGDLEPEGPPGPTMKTIDQAEPRIPIDPDDVPLVIDTPGSYYLTGDLDCASAGANCLKIDNQESVTIDLMGFTVYGNPDLTVIYAQDSSNLTVRNGSINGGGFGILIDSGSMNKFLDLKISDVSRSGIRAGVQSLVKDCLITGSDNAGVQLDDKSVVRDTVVTDSQYGSGITVGARSLVVDVVVESSGWHGIFLGSFSRVRNAIATKNEPSGIHVAYSAQGVVIENSTVERNNGNGLEVTSKCFVLNNHIYGNAPGSEEGAGIEATGSDNRIEANNLIGNDVGIQVDGSGNVVVRNMATGNYTDYSIATGNDVGPIGSVASADSPWANISY